MNTPMPVILSNAKDPSFVGGVPSPRGLQTTSWILRCAQNDRLWLLAARCLVCLLFSVLCPLVRASEPTDLGQGLGYLRVHSLADSVKAAATSTALVLDLRYAIADDASTTVLKAALASRPANAPLFILVSPATPPVLAPLISQSRAFTLGVADAQPAPKVVVGTDAATDRKAYDALEAGAAIDTLISGKIEKERFDEASLVQEFKNGNPDAAPLPGGRPGQTPAGQQTGTVSPGPDPTAPQADSNPVKPAAPAVRLVERPTDRVLQRVVHLHRALLALRR